MRAVAAQGEAGNTLEARATRVMILHGGKRYQIISVL
jgi:hypothetical protein